MFDAWADVEWEDHAEARDLVARFPSGMSYDEIAIAMGITRSRVQQVEAIALRKLRDGTAGDYALAGGIAVPVGRCRRCGDPFVRRYGRQSTCVACVRRRDVPVDAALARAAALSRHRGTDEGSARRIEARRESLARREEEPRTRVRGRTPYGSVSAAARRLGVSASAFWYRYRTLGSLDAAVAYFEARHPPRREDPRDDAGSDDGGRDAVGG